MTRNIFKRIFKRCRHKNVKFIKNIHGDEINFYNGYRSLWKCEDCGCILKSEILITDKEDYKNAKFDKMVRTIYRGE